MNVFTGYFTNMSINRPLALFSVKTTMKTLLQVQNKVEAGSSLHDSLIETTGPEKTIFARMYRITCHKLNPVIS